MAIAVAIQLAVFFILVLGTQSYAPWLQTVSVAISVIVLAFILNSRMHMEYKLMWTIVIMLTPFFGGMFYLLFGSRTGTNRQMRRWNLLKEKASHDQDGYPGLLELTSHSVPVLETASQREMPHQEIVLHDAQSDSVDKTSALDIDAMHMVEFLSSLGSYYPYSNTQTDYYPVGEEAFAQILADLEGATSWIGIEYFIISDGVMWDTIFDILKQKAAHGVDVRLMFDDLGSMWDLPDNLIKECEKAGIKVRPVNRFGPGVTLRYNNRDHRKILVIDGLIAYTGGINIADEYINHKQRFGHWKDTTIRLAGYGAWGMVTLFFTLWDHLNSTQTSLVDYRPDPARLAQIGHHQGVVISYDDTPLDDYSLGWAVYRNTLMRAHSSIDIMTPYLIPTAEMINSIASMAQSGVRVRICVPGIPDKKYVYAVTQSNYKPLIKAGVEIYEYTPGFLHAKQMVVDAKSAVIGTINFDYRSFYLHQENAVWMYDTEAVSDMVSDFDKTISMSRRVTAEEVNSVPWWKRAIWIALRTFAPIM